MTNPTKKFETLQVYFTTGSYEWKSQWQSQWGTNGKDVNFHILDNAGTFENGTDTMVGNGTISDTITFTQNGIMNIKSKYDLTKMMIPESDNMNDLHDFEYCLDLEVARFTNNINYKDDISCLHRLVKLTRLDVHNTNVSGSIESLVEKMVASGRTSGTLLLNSTTNITINEHSAFGSTWPIVFGASEVNVYFQSTSTLSATYNISTGTWTYQ